MPLCEDARTCNLCGGPVVGVPDDALDSGSGAPVHPDLSAGHQWLSHASVLKSHREFLPWQHEHPRRDPAQAAAERQRAAAEYARLAKAEEELEGPTEDDEGDWYFSPRWDDDTYTNKRFLLTPSGNLTGDKVQAVVQECCLWYQVAGWPAQGSNDEPWRTGPKNFDDGGGLLVHTACGGILERCLRASGLAVRMEDVWRFLIRSGCPDGSEIEYGGDIAEHWDGNDFEMPAGSEWLCDDPTQMPAAVLAAARQPAPLAVVEAWEAQPRSRLLSLDEHSLALVIDSVAREHGESLLALAGCCRQLRHAAEARQAVMEASCLSAAPFLDWGAVQQQQHQQQQQQQHQDKEEKQHARRRARTASSGAAVDWKACYAALMGSGLPRNGARIHAVLQAMVGELMQPAVAAPVAA